MATIDGQSPVVQPPIDESIDPVTDEGPVLVRGKQDTSDGVEVRIRTYDQLLADSRNERESLSRVLQKHAKRIRRQHLRDKDLGTPAYALALTNSVCLDFRALAILTAPSDASQDPNRLSVDVLLSIEKNPREAYQATIDSCLAQATDKASEYADQLMSFEDDKESVVVAASDR